MGLDTTHDCWHGAYSRFMRWRRDLAHAAGLPPLDLMEGFFGRGDSRDPFLDYARAWPDLAEIYYRSLPIRWDSLKPDPLHLLLHHSDCEGEIATEDCGPIADSLERLLPLLESEGGGFPVVSARHCAEQFITGLRLAASRGEPVRFQ
jgi:hypothetical protein